MSLQMLVELAGVRTEDKPRHKKAERTRSEYCEDAAITATGRLRERVRLMDDDTDYTVVQFSEVIGLKVDNTRCVLLKAHRLGFVTRRLIRHGTGSYYVYRRKD